MFTKVVEDGEKIRKPLLSTSTEGQEIVRQFVEQGMIDARLSGKKVTFIELDQIGELLAMNTTIDI